jgi:hypothetical protein
MKNKAVSFSRVLGYAVFALLQVAVGADTQKYPPHPWAHFHSADRSESAQMGVGFVPANPKQWKQLEPSQSTALKQLAVTRAILWEARNEDRKAFFRAYAQASTREQQSELKKLWRDRNLEWAERLQVEIRAAIARSRQANSD